MYRATKLYQVQMENGCNCFLMSHLSMTAFRLDKTIWKNYVGKFRYKSVCFVSV